MYAIINGKIVLPDQVIEGYNLLIRGDKIEAIVPARQQIAAEYCQIDARGGHVSAGFIDIHSDYIEHITAPRPSSIMDFNLALREAERELLCHGVTTMYHSLSMYKEKQAYSKPIRNRKNVEQLIAVIHDTHYRKHLIRHRFHARFEIDNIENIESLKRYIKAGTVDLLSFMDHTPGQGQYRDIAAYKKMNLSYGSKLSESELDAKIKASQDKAKLTVAQCGELAEIARQNGIAVASHDDDSTEKIDRLTEIGATISEFPITLDVARYAHQMGLYTIVGAPNVILGGSHSGNLAAHAAIEAGVIDILCSDYYPASLLHAIYKLHRVYRQPLHEMFKLLTVNPARAVGIDDQVGEVASGKKADLLIIEQIEGDFPVITSCFVDGEHVFETRYRI